jgi:helix-turn-helix protein
MQLSDSEIWELEVGFELRRIWKLRGSGREDVKQFVFETSADEFEEELDLDLDDAENSSMVQDSFNGQEDNEESALGELEELSEQMEALESE